jgi:hypothetical protein
MVAHNAFPTVSARLRTGGVSCGQQGSGTPELYDGKFGMLAYCFALRF